MAVAVRGSAGLHGLCPTQRRQAFVPSIEVALARSQALAPSAGPRRNEGGPFLVETTKPTTHRLRVPMAN